MKNTIISLGAIGGVILGALLAVFFFGGSSDTSFEVTALLGAMVGAVVGGWIAARIVDRES